MGDSKSLVFLQENHLFHPQYLANYQNNLLLMFEDRKKLTTYRYHQHRLVFTLSSMRHYAHELRQQDMNLIYFDLTEAQKLTAEELVEKVLRESGLQKITTFEIEDKNLEARLEGFCKSHNIAIEVVPSPQFLVSRVSFRKFLEQNQRPSLKKFYEVQRQKLNILMDPNGEPLGGQFSFAERENLKWKGENHTPKFPISVHDEIDQEVIKLVRRSFPNNPGDATTAWYPTSREQINEILLDFCKYRLPEYGHYEDGLSSREDFLFHSALSPALNAGLLTPKEVLDTILESSKEWPIPLVSLESYISNLLGHREYSRGIYQNFQEDLEQRNFWKHHRLLSETWHQGTTGVPPLDEALKKAERLGYNHHTERLKVICNMMTLAEINPLEAFHWFQEMYLDSATWALVPNLYALGLNSNGCLFTNQLHIHPSNYWLKIGTYEKGEWCHEVDGLYWRFIEKHLDYFTKHPRFSLIAKNLDRMTSERKETLWRAATAFLSRNTVYP